MTLDEILRDYLTGLNGLRPADLGGTDSSQTPTAEQTSALCARLAERSRYNTHLCTLIVIFQCITFAIGVALVLGLKSSTAGAAVAGSGSLGILFMITRRLQRFWAEKSAIDLFNTVAPELPPSEVVKMAQAIYFKRQGESTQT